MEIVLLNEVGERFCFSRASVKTTNPTVLGVTVVDGVMAVKASSKGHGYIIVEYLKHLDIIYIQVGSPIKPSGAVRVHRGGSIQFQAEGSGKWKSSNSGVV